MGTCNHDEALTPEMDATVARVAMGERDWSHAAHHVAGALASDPHRPDLLALLDELVAASGDGLALFPIAGGTWYGAAAVHARLLAPTDPTGALDLLCQVAAARPDVPYLPWAGPWLPRVDPAQAGRSFQRLLAISAEPGTAGVTHGLLPALELLVELRERFPDEPSLWAISSMLTRRSGQPDVALALARTAFQRFPSWNSAVALANACKAVQQWDETQAAWAAALELDPNDVSVRLDWADSLLDRAELPASRGKYQEVLDRQPEHAWAVPSAAYVDWLARPTVDGRLALIGYADRHADNKRARWVADKATPWVGRLPSPQEATLSAFGQLLQSDGDLGELQMSLSHLESAGSQVAARRYLAERGGRLLLSVGQVATPDPRQPRFPARWSPWRWDGTVAEPALPPPGDPAAATILAKLASSAFHSATWQAHGVQIARQHGLGNELTEDGAEALLRAALHPPPGPSWSTPWEWSYRVMHAAAFVAAGYPGWDGTVQRELLRSMLAVRADWFTVAAAAAAGERGQAADARRELRDLLFDVARSAPDAGYWCAGWPATCALLRLGVDDPELRTVLLRNLRDWEESTADA